MGVKLDHIICDVMDGQILMLSLESELVFLSLSLLWESTGLVNPPCQLPILILVKVKCVRPNLLTTTKVSSSRLNRTEVKKFLYRMFRSAFKKSILRTWLLWNPSRPDGKTLRSLERPRKTIFAAQPRYSSSSPRPFEGQRTSGKGYKGWFVNKVYFFNVLFNDYFDRFSQT